jgi:thiol-disulfide isomerase/thioredoxin
VARTALVTVLLSSTAVLAYLGYRALDLIPVDSAAETVVTSTAVDMLPEFSLENLAGEQQAIGSWSGKALLINFWATWCAPCLREIPLLVSYQDEFRNDAVQVVGIAVDRSEPVHAFVENMEFNYPVLIGQAEAMDAAAAFGVDFFGLPFSVFTDTTGHILGVHSGELHAEDLDNLARVLRDIDAGTTDLEGARARLAGRR